MKCEKRDEKDESVLSQGTVILKNGARWMCYMSSSLELLGTASHDEEIFVLLSMRSAVKSENQITKEDVRIVYLRELRSWWQRYYRLPAVRPIIWASTRRPCMRRQ